MPDAKLPCSVGETAEALDRMRENVKDHPPYVVPCFDLARTSIAHEKELYLHTIPYLQFPQLMAGRPFTGERMALPDFPNKEDTAKPGVWTRTRHARKIWELYQRQPEGPHSYG